MTAQTWNPDMGKAEAKGLYIQGQSGIDRKPLPSTLHHRERGTENKMLSLKAL